MVDGYHVESGDPFQVLCPIIDLIYLRSLQDEFPTLTPPPELTQYIKSTASIDLHYVASTILIRKIRC